MASPTALVRLSPRWSWWRAREAHQTGRAGAFSCLGSGERSPRRPSAPEPIPWDASRALPGGPPRLDLPRPYLPRGTRGQAVPCRGAGLGGPEGRAVGPAVGTPAPRRVSAASARKARGGFVQSRVLGPFAWLRLGSGAVCQPAPGGVQASALCESGAGIGSELLRVQMKWNALYKWTKNKKTPIS